MNYYHVLKKIVTFARKIIYFNTLLSDKKEANLMASEK